MGQADVTVSLEPHLVQALSPLPALLPTPLSSDLSTALSIASTSSSDSNNTTSEISHNLLTRVSQWSRLPASQTVLKSHQLDPHAYLMISLLAGTRTSPQSKLARYQAPEQPEITARRRLNDKKEITAIVNSLLTVGACGTAVWWAAEKAGWRQEWVSLHLTIVST